MLLRVGTLLSGALARHSVSGNRWRVWRLLTCALLMARLIGAETPAKCEVPNHLFIWHSVWDFSRKATFFPLPSVDGGRDASSGSAPAVLSVTVDSQGSVVEVKRTSGSDTPGLRAVTSSMSRWRFTPFLYNGTPICMRATVYVYFRNRQGQPELIISGFTDRDQPPGAAHER